MNKNKTALISCFARYYHTEKSNIKIYNDKFVKEILNTKEIEEISKSMIDGICFFNPNYQGENPLEWIVNNYLAPSILARSIFNEKHLINEIALGLKQYVILASGYDTSAYKINNKIKVFELNNKYIDNTYFHNYNTINPNNRINTPRGVSYVLLEKNR